MKKIFIAIVIALLAISPVMAGKKHKRNKAMLTPEQKTQKLERHKKRLEAKVAIRKENHIALAGLPPEQRRIKKLELKIARSNRKLAMMKSQQGKPAKK